MWSSVDGCFKVLDFSLTFHKEDRDLHQIQTKGYQAPEAAEWNTYKEDVRRIPIAIRPHAIYHDLSLCSSRNAGKGNYRARTQI